MAWSRDRCARVGLAILVLGWLIAAFVVRWRAVVVVDDRTYVEMAAGVRDHGLPYVTNTWSDVFPETHPSFLVPNHGKLWGQYPPLYAYLAAPALALGGLVAVYKLGAIVLAIMCVVVARLGKHVWGDELAGTIAAWLISLGLPIVMTCTQTLSMPLSLALSSGALLVAARAVRERKLRFLVATGVLSGLSIATHLIETAIAGALCLTVILAGERDVRSLARRGAAVVLPFAIVLAPVAWLDRVRFGSSNPFSYGPCPWWSCTYVIEQSMTAPAMLRWASPGLVPMFIGAIGWWLLRARPLRIRLAWLGGCLALAMLVPLCRGRLITLVATMFGYFIDATLLDLSATHPRYGSLGWIGGQYVILGLLESSPWIALVITARRRLAGRPRMLAILVVPLVAFALELSLFGRLRGAYALGLPYLISRYALYSAPLVATLASGSIARMQFDRRHLFIGIAITAALVAWFGPTPTDILYVRRVFLVCVVPLVAVALVAAVLLARKSERFARVAPALAVVTIAIGVGNSVARQDAEAARQLDWLTYRLERFEQLVPARFALAGWGGDTDPILALRAERDIAYMDFVESQHGWSNFRRMIDVWNDEGRPIYGVFPHDVPFEWPFADWDVPAQQLDPVEQYWKIGPPRRRWNDPLPEHAP